MYIYIKSVFFFSWVLKCGDKVRVLMNVCFLLTFEESCSGGGVLFVSPLSRVCSVLGERERERDTKREGMCGVY